MFNKYYQLTKPGVLYGNALTTVAGFLMASNGGFDTALFLATVFGSTLIIASATTINNYLDQDIDRLMTRTKNRPLIIGLIKPRNALIFGILLGISGVALLIAYVSWLVVIIGLVGFVVYVFLYGALSKRRSMHGTLVGSISGAMPILAGYAAASGTIDTGGVIVFLILFFWQFPEFYSISIYRRKEYKAAGIPVISVVKGVEHTKLQILFYTAAFVIATISLTAFGYTGLTYLIIMSTLGLYWVRIGLDGLKTDNNDRWARRMFRFSLVMILALCVMLPVGVILP